VVALTLLSFGLAADAAPAANSSSTKGNAPATTSRRAPVQVRSADPYLGAIVLDAATGRVLFEDKADEIGHPASLVKMMGILIVMEHLQAGTISLTNAVRVTADSARIGGSQVFLAEKEVFPLEELLAATAIHSANDAATALAIHLAGTKEGFVELMNKRAAELGLRSTRFTSVHGLPPSSGQKPDVSTARDIAALARELLKHSAVLRYTAMQNRPFRNGTFGLRNPNHLLGEFPGCDGLKTGYIAIGGFSIAATAQRGGRRIVAVVLGSKDRAVREVQAAKLLSKGFLTPAAPLPDPTAVAVAATNAVARPAPEAAPAEQRPWTPMRIGLAVAIGVVALLIVSGLIRNRNLPR
jgi:D-alanyl-D-alanine carboxypeptidase (penicillin-binding protein 5/6)